MKKKGINKGGKPRAAIHTALPSAVGQPVNFSSLLPLVPVLLTLIIRILFILEVRHLPFSWVSPYVVDSWAYHRWALEIVNGDFWGSEVFFLRPIYPYLLALLYKLFGPKVLIVQVFQALLATASSFLLYRCTEKIFNRSAAFVAGIGFALCGVLTFYTGALLYVEITIFFSLLTLYLFTATRFPLPTYRLVFAGISFGLLVICRPELLLLAPLLLIYLWQNKTSLKGVALFSLISLLTIGIVPLRNFAVARDPVFFTAHSGINFYYGNNPSADGTWQSPPELSTGLGFSHERLKKVAKVVEGKELTWSRASSYWTKKGVNYILTHPLKWLQLLLRKFLLFGSNYEIPNNYYPETVRPFSRVLKIAFINYGVVAALGIIGMFFARRNRRALPVYLFVLGYLGSALIFYVLSRLRAPVIPFLLMFTGSAVTEIYQLLRHAPKRRVGIVSLGIAALIYFATNLIPVNRNPYSAQAWTQLGNIYLERHRTSSAIEALNRALQFDQDNAAARYSLILAYASVRRVPEAEREFFTLTQNNPDALELHHLAAARIAIATRDFSRAIEHYHAALEHDPNNPETLYLLGMVFISINKLDSAEFYLERATLLDPWHDAARNALAMLRTKR